MYEPKQLYQSFQRLKIDEKLSKSMGEKVSIALETIQCLKSTKRSSIYKLNVQNNSKTLPVIFKIYNSSNYKNEVEINLYKQAYPVLKEFLPKIYIIEENVNKDETWLFMEFVNQIRGQLTFTPDHFKFIIPTVAKLHADTFEGNFKKHGDIWKPWLPVYDSSSMRKDRNKYIKKTIEFLDQGVKDKRVKDLIKPHYDSLIQLYKKGPDFFPELLENGFSITHGDLHMQNICSHNVSEQSPWEIQFIDWESAKYSPPMLDMVVLVEILLAFRKDWQSRGEEIRTQCVEVYKNEMKKHGIEFKTDPMDLYKMAYLQRTLEKGLHTQLRRLFDNRGGELLPYHLDRISTWGKELGLYK